MDGIELKVEMQSRGVRVQGVFERAGGAGPADGITLMFGGLVATVPTKADFVARSPYSIVSREGSLELEKDGRAVAAVRSPEEPAFYSMETPGGTSFKRLALRHGLDGIGSTVLQECSHEESSCRFCGIAVSLESGATTRRKTPGELAMVSSAAAREGFEHAVLTTGTAATPDRGIELLAACARAVKDSSKMRVHVQFEPPDDLSWIDEAARFADTCAINIESFDGSVREKMTPGKAVVPVDYYVEAWKKAVDAFGAGRVTSFIILGLGESDSSVEEGVALLASLGVYPFLLPLRPLKGTPLQPREPPDASRVLSLFEKCAPRVTAAGLRASECPAGCVRCSACSSFPDLTC